MPCKPYQNALVEAAATGVELQGELRAHVAACPACRAAFVEEQSLFSSIDASLHATANTEVPASLLPSVCARLAEESVARRMWTGPMIFAAASLVLAFVIFLFAWPHPSRPDSEARQIPQFPVNAAPATNPRRQNSDPGARIASSSINKVQTTVHSTLLRAVASGKPEVLVPPGEREAFSDFVFMVQQHDDLAAALLAPAPKQQGALVTLEPLHITDLELKPLEGRETEMSRRIGE